MQVKRCFFDNYIGDFFAIKTKREIVSYSYNAEVGWTAVKSKNFLLYVAAGPYYMAGSKFHRTVRGGEARIRPQYKDYFAVDFSVSHDRVFKTTYQAEIIISIPLYQISGQNKGPCRITDYQIYQRVERFEIMPLGRSCCWKSNF